MAKEEIKNKTSKKEKKADKREKQPTVGVKGGCNRSFVRIKVAGIGGGGGNAITRMRDGFIRGVDFIAINTDAQDLEYCVAKQRIHIGRVITRGMGAGMDPELGRKAAEENKGEIAEALRDTDIVFLTAGFGGGTGTGATPVIADIAKESGILTVAVVTKPFSFEGAARMRIAEDGIAELRNKVDTLLVVPNDRIFNIIDNDTPIIKAFEKIDEILKSAVQGIAEMISSAGLINVDFADVRAIMANAGEAVIGVGTSSGQGRAMKAVKQSITSPLLERTIEGARGVLFAVAGGRDLKMSEINESARAITDVIDSNAKIIFGAYHDRKLKAGQIKVVLVATGFDGMAFSRAGAHPLELFAPEVKASLLAEERLEKESRGKKVEETVSEIMSSTDEEPIDQKTEMGEIEEDIWGVPAFLRRKKR
ncbi:MAG: cell division protein FtsZ [bacterium]